MENPLVVLVQITRAFDALEVDYAVVGSFASSIHGEYRASGDLDIIADLRIGHISSLVAALKEEFYVDDLTIHRAIAGGRSFNVIHLKAIFKVDIFIPATPLAKQQLSRRERHKLDPIEDQIIWIASAEDTILAKLQWFRMGNEVSELQWRDVRGIMGTRGSDLDFEYLNRWAERLGLLDLLERAVKESQ